MYYHKTEECGKRLLVFSQKLISFFYNYNFSFYCQILNVKKEVIEKIQKWLDEESIEFTPLEYPFAEFNVDTKNPNQTIRIPKNKPDSIEFLTNASFANEDQKAYVALKNKEEKIRILFDLQRSLLEINVGYKMKKI